MTRGTPGSAPGAPNGSDDQTATKPKYTGPSYVQIVPGQLDNYARGLSFDAKATLTFVTLYANFLDGVFRGITVTALAKHLGLQRRRLTNALDELALNGLIEFEFRRGHDGWIRVLPYEAICLVGSARAKYKGSRRSARTDGVGSRKSAHGSREPAHTSRESARSTWDNDPSDISDAYTSQNQTGEFDEFDAFMAESIGFVDEPEMHSTRDRLAHLLAPLGVSADDARRAVDYAIGQDGVCDLVADEVVGFMAERISQGACWANPCGYYRKVARDWQNQRMTSAA